MGVERRREEGGKCANGTIGGERQARRHPQERVALVHRTARDHCEAAPAGVRIGGHLQRRREDAGLDARPIIKLFDGGWLRRRRQHGVWRVAAHRRAARHHDLFNWAELAVEVDEVVERPPHQVIVQVVDRGHVVGARQEQGRWRRW